MYYSALNLFGTNVATLQKTDKNTVNSVAEISKVCVTRNWKYVVRKNIDTVINKDRNGGNMSQQRNQAILVLTKHKFLVRKVNNPGNNHDRTIRTNHLFIYVLTVIGCISVEHTNEVTTFTNIQLKTLCEFFNSEATKDLNTNASIHTESSFVRNCEHHRLVADFDCLGNPAIT